MTTPPMAKAMVRALDDSKKQTLSEDARNELDNAEDSDCIVVPSKKGKDTLENKRWG